jgi:hypothetical protein
MLPNIWYCTIERDRPLSDIFSFDPMVYKDINDPDYKPRKDEIKLEITIKSVSEHL